MLSDPLARLRWNDRSLWSQFAELAADRPSAIALIDVDDRPTTRDELSRAACALVNGLQDAGVRPGDRVLYRPERAPRTAVVALALSQVGAVLCCEPPDAADDLADSLGVRATMTRDSRIVSHGAPTTDRDPRDDRCVLIATTSGSTGRPKYVMHGSEALNYSARACAAIAGLEPGETMFAAIGPESAAGFTLSIHMALSLGQPLVLASRWDAVEAMRRIVAHGCRWTTMVPTQLLAMIEATRDGRWTGTLPLRAIAVGGSAMTAALIDEAALLLGTAAVRMFGLSECLAHCSSRVGDRDPRRLTSDGLPFPATTLEAFSADGHALPRDQRGQAGVRGPSLFLGYARGHGAGEEHLTADGHLLTGDEIVRDVDGYVQVVGRLKDQIIRGGFNIDPAEVETIISLHPAVAEVAVVPIPDERLGERACAVVRLRHGASPVTFDSIRATLADAGLYRRKWPETFVIVDALPRLSGGKVDRRAIAALALRTML